APAAVPTPGGADAGGAVRAAHRPARAAPEPFRSRALRRRPRRGPAVRSASRFAGHGVEDVLAPVVLGGPDLADLLHERAEPGDALRGGGELDPVPGEVVLVLLGGDLAVLRLGQDLRGPGGVAGDELAGAGHGLVQRVDDVGVLLCVLLQGPA